MTDDFDPIWMGAFIPIEHWHFHRRLLARYGIVIGPGEFGRMLRDIEKGRALAVARRSETRTVYCVRIKGADRFVYALADGSRIVTALPPKKSLNELRRERVRKRATRVRVP